jgi:hypothetical protein
VKVSERCLKLCFPTVPNTNDSTYLEEIRLLPHCQALLKIEHCDKGTIIELWIENYFGIYYQNIARLCNLCLRPEGYPTYNSLVQFFPIQIDDTDADSFLT